MPISFSVLGSGSSGNCALVRLSCESGARHLLIDAGLGPRQTISRLAPLGVGPDDVAAVVLTHTDRDHLSAGWMDLDPPLRATWWVHRRHVAAALAAGVPVRRLEAFEEAVEIAPGTRLEPTLQPHDRLGTVGFVLDHQGARLGWATDLGRVPPSMPCRFGGLSALALESNYDPPMQASSSRPPVLKRRIMGGLGHLSNEQALGAVVEIARRSDLRHLVLLHLSSECNDPGIVRRLYAARAPHLLPRLTIARQHQPTPLLHLDRRQDDAAPLTGRQLSFLEAPLL